ncbi:MAG TPA: phosphonate ABC transporter ATP-binding protein [Stellaceae bacterium]|nr:phosphonate ABC transporter ATP-binding protein [Stellaceae bacterium]
MTRPTGIRGAGIRVVGLTKRIGDRKVLDGVSFEVNPGEIVAVLGASGAGKTTLFRCLTRLAQCDDGEIFFDGENYANTKEVGLVFQQFNLIRRLSALDNVLAGRLAYVPTWRVMLRRFPYADRQIALASLDRVGLLPYALQRADRLSGGQQQRVAIARALAQHTRFVLADEPVASLDPESAKGVLSILREVARERAIAVLVSLHQVDFALQFADRVIGLRHGRMITDLAAAQFAETHRQMIYAT